MVIHNIRPDRNFTQLDNNVLRLKNIHSGVKVLYCFIASLKNGQRISREYLAKSLGVSVRTISTQIGELEKRNLLLVDRVSAKEYDCYIGTSKLPASKTKEYWVDIESLTETITDEELLQMQKEYIDKINKMENK